MAIIKGPVNPVISGTTTFPDLKSVQVTAPNRHSVRPSLVLDFANARTMDPRITFTRGSTGTYYDGFSTALAEQNVIPYSQDFTNGTSWPTINNFTTAAGTYGQTAPDGTSTATLFTPNTTSGLHRIVSLTVQPTNTGTYTIYNGKTHSVYVKANGYTKVALRESTTTGDYVVFDLSNATTVTSSGSVTNATVVPVGNNWYRISANFYDTRQQSLGIHILNASYTSGDIYSYNYAGDGTSGMYVWGAQMENRNILGPYTATTGNEVSTYVPVLKTASANQPRFDHNPVTGESLGLLMEPAKTNLLTYSNGMSSGWTYQQLTLSINSAIAPDGTLTASRILENTVSDNHQIYQTMNVSAGTYTMSVHAKAYGTRNSILMSFYTNGGITSVQAKFNLATGTVISNSSSSAVITNVGNGWYRCSITNAIDANLLYPLVRTINAAGTDAYAGDGFSGVFLWGIQLELGSWPTSYIPTTSASASRDNDNGTFSTPALSTWYNPNKGTVVLNTSTVQWTNYTYWFYTQSVKDTTALSTNGTNWGVLDENVLVMGVDSGSAVNKTSDDKVAFSYVSGNATSGSVSIVVRGGSAVTSSKTVLPATATNNTPGLALTSTSGGTSRIKRLVYYPTALSTTEMQSLTAA